MFTLGGGLGMNKGIRFLRRYNPIFLLSHESNRSLCLEEVVHTIYYEVVKRKQTSYFDTKIKCTKFLVYIKVELWQNAQNSCANRGVAIKTRKGLVHMAIIISQNC